MIGIDLVYLPEARTSKYHGHAAFVTKMCPTEEQAMFSKELQDPNQVWMFWAAKESCFKALPPQRQSRFSPRKIRLTEVVKRSDGMDIECRFEDLDYYCRVSMTDDHILSLCTLNKDDLDRAIFSIREEKAMTSMVQSGQLRCHATEILSPLIGKDLVFGTTQNGQPLVYASEFEPSPITFSHHGPYTAFAFIPSFN